MTEPASVLDLLEEELVQIDHRVDAAEGEGIYERWLFGQRLLRERKGKQLPNGLLEQLSERTGKSRTELQYRVQFADRYPAEEVSNAVGHFKSWHAIVNQALASTAHLSSAKDEWATPQDLFDALDAEFNFTLDVCAQAANTKCGNFYSEDALEQPWEGVCWMNPPYSQVVAFMAKAYDSAQSGATVVCLVPSRTDVGWFWDYARHGQVRFLRGRLHFVDDEGNTGPAPFPSVVVVFGRPAGVIWWEP